MSNEYSRIAKQIDHQLGSILILGKALPNIQLLDKVRRIENPISTIYDPSKSIQQKIDQLGLTQRDKVIGKAFQTSIQRINHPYRFTEGHIQKDPQRHVSHTPERLIIVPGSGDKEVRRLLEDLSEHFRERVIEALDSYHADNERTAIDLISPFILLVKEAIHAGNTKSIRPPVLSNLDQLNEERRIERETEWNEWRKEAEGIRK